MTDSKLTLWDVIHSLIDRRGATTDADVQNMHDAVEAHQRGLEHGGIVADERAAQADSGLEAKYEGVSDSDLAEQALDGDTDAGRERRRRRAMAATAKAEPDKEPVKAEA